MKFYDTKKQPISENLEEQYRSAVSVVPMRIGNGYVFYRSGFKTIAVDLSEVTRIFRRIRAVHASLGCCGGDLNMNYIVFCDASGEIAEVEFENESFALAAYEELKAMLPGAAFGKN